MRGCSSVEPPFPGVTLRQLRLRLGVAQREIALRVGVDPSVVSRYESSVNPRLSTIRAYAKALGAHACIFAIVTQPDGTLEPYIVRIAEHSLT